MKALAGFFNKEKAIIGANVNPCEPLLTALNTIDNGQALVVGEISLSSAWLVDISHLLLAVASAANVAIFAAMVRTPTLYCVCTV